MGSSMGESGGSRADLASAAMHDALQEVTKGVAPAAGSGAPHPPPPAPPEPSPETGSYIAKYAVQFLAIVGGGGVGIVGVVAAVGLLAHNGHLAMLGLPHFPMSPGAYSQLALEFFTYSLHVAVSYPLLSVGWLIATLLLVAVVAAYPWLCRRGYLRSDGATCRYTHSPVLHLLCFFVVVVAGGQLLRLSTTALTGKSTGLIWAIYSDPDKALGQKPTGGRLSDANIRWCVFHRSGADDANRRLARRRLEDYYSRLVGGTGLVLLLFVATQRGRRRLAARPAEQGSYDPPGLLAAADIMLEVPAVVILTLLLIALPANYGALMMPTTYPTAQIVEENAAAEEIPVSGFLLSPPTSDAKSVCLLDLAMIPISRDEAAMQWALRTRRLDPPWQIELQGYSDILDETRSQIEVRQ